MSPRTIGSRLRSISRIVVARRVPRHPGQQLEPGSGSSAPRRTHIAREIIENLRANEISIDDQAVYYRRVQAHALAALDVMETPGSAIDEAFLIDAYQASQVRQRLLAQTAYEEMKSARAGQERRRARNSARLSAFYAQMPQINALTLAVTAYRDRVRRAMPISIQRQLRERCGDINRRLPGGVVGSVLPERCVLGLDRESVARAAGAHPGDARTQPGFDAATSPTSIKNCASCRATSSRRL